MTCSIACVFSAIHLARLMGLECNPARVLNATCVCKTRENASNSTETAVRYMDLNCPEVESILTILLIFSSTCNAFGALVAGWYTYLHWSTRHKRPKYMQVRTNPTRGNNFLSSRPIYNPNLNERWHSSPNTEEHTSYLRYSSLTMDDEAFEELSKLIPTGFLQEICS